MAALPYPRVSLKEIQSNKIAASINMADIQQMIQIKEQVENAAGSLHTRLFLAEGNVPNGFSTVSAHGPIMIGHELAHLYLDHGRSRQDREENRMAASAILSIALGMFGIPIPFEVMNVAAESVSTKFSREEERDADRLGVEYMVHAGFDPFGSVRLQEKLGAASSGDMLPFLSSHPSSSERVENMKRLAMEHKPGQVALPPVKENSVKNKDISQQEQHQ